LKGAMHTTTASRLGIATLSLSAALAVYCLARIYPPALLEPLQATLPALAAQTALFGSLPSLLYTLAIGLLIGCCASTPGAARLHCLLWLGIALMLELAQHPLVSAPVSERLYDMVTESTWQVIGPYWTRGSFDPLDLLATLIGGVIALVLFGAANRKNKHEINR
jgi:hypothetical protein